MTARAVSSVLDVTVCLLLVSASALTLTQVQTAPDREESDRADIALEVLTTSTAWVEYGSSHESRSNWTAHGTLANLLAAAAVANATDYDESRAPPPDAFRRAVRASVHRSISQLDFRMQVLARCQSSHGTLVGGEFVVGSPPPPAVDTHAASTTIPWESTGPAHTESVGAVRLTVRTWSP